MLTDDTDRIQHIIEKLDSFRTDVVDRLARMETSQGSTHRWVQAHEERLSHVETSNSKLKGFGTAVAFLWTLLLGLVAYIFKTHSHGVR